MKKLIGLLMLLLTLAILAGCTSTPKVKKMYGEVQVLEHKGSRFGLAQPEWVSIVLDSPNQKTLTKALGIDKHIWVVTRTGPNLDFLQQWTDQIDARSEIAASIKQGISDYVGAKMEGEPEDSVEKTIARYSERAAMITLTGLNKETEYWTKTRTQLEKNAEPIIEYNYMVIYSLDEKLYQDQIKMVLDDFSSFNNEENTKQLFEYFDTEIKFED